jgi:electron transfer flavoprotein alpha subunit
MHCEIVIVAECNEGELDPITLDLIAWGCPVAQEKDWAIGVLVLGFGLDPIIQQLAGQGMVDHLFAVDNPRFETYNSSVYVNAIANAIREIKPELILTAHSYTGIEIAAALAPLLNASLVANCHSIEAADDGFLVTRSMFAAKFVATIAVAGTHPVLITMSRESSVVRSLATRNCQLHRLQLPSHGEAQITVVSTSAPSRTEDITKAKIVVAIGRAISHESQIESFRQLASALGGVIAASRPIVDLGWLNSDHQVGLSGVTVKPKVYLALGISGSAQHIVGMNQSRLIIAINNDASAPIFQFAHCGAVADVFEILPVLLEKSMSKNLDRGTGPAR